MAFQYQGSWKISLIKALFLIFWLKYNFGKFFCLPHFNPNFLKGSLSRDWVFSLKQYHRSHQLFCFQFSSKSQNIKEGSVCQLLLWFTPSVQDRKICHKSTIANYVFLWDLYRYKFSNKYSWNVLHIFNLNDTLIPNLWSIQDGNQAKTNIHHTQSTSRICDSHPAKTKKKASIKEKKPETAATHIDWPKQFQRLFHNPFLLLLTCSGKKEQRPTGS